MASSAFSPRKQLLFPSILQSKVPGLGRRTGFGTGQQGKTPASAPTAPGLSFFFHRRISVEGRGPGADGWTLPGKPPAGQAPVVVSSQFPASKSERKPPVPSLLQGQEQRTSVWGCRGKETRQGAPGSLEATSWDKPPLTFVPRLCKRGRASHRRTAWPFHGVPAESGTSGAKKTRDK